MRKLVLILVILTVVRKSALEKWEGGGNPHLVSALRKVLKSGEIHDSDQNALNLGARLRSRRDLSETTAEPSFFKNILFTKIKKMAEIIDKKANFYFHKFPSAGTYYGDENPNEGEPYPWANSEGYIGAQKSIANSSPYTTQSSSFESSTAGSSNSGRSGRHSSKYSTPSNSYEHLGSSSDKQFSYASGSSFPSSYTGSSSYSGSSSISPLSFSTSSIRPSSDSVFSGFLPSAPTELYNKMAESVKTFLSYPMGGPSADKYPVNFSKTSSSSTYPGSTLTTPYSGTSSSPSPSSSFKAPSSTYTPSATYRGSSSSYSPEGSSSSYSSAGLSSSYSSAESSSSHSSVGASSSHSSAGSSSSHSSAGSSSTYYPKGSSSSYPPVGSSSTYTPVGSSSSYAPVGSSSSYAPVGSSSSYTPVGSSSTYAPVGSSSTYAPVGSSSTYAPVGSSSTYAPVESSSFYSTAGSKGTHSPSSSFSGSSTVYSPSSSIIVASSSSMPSASDTNIKSLSPSSSSTTTGSRSSFSSPSDEIGLPSPQAVIPSSPEATKESGKILIPENLAEFWDLREQLKEMIEMLNDDLPDEELDARYKGLDILTQGLNGSTQGLDGSTQGLDGSTQGLDGSTQGLDGSTQGLVGSTQGLDNSTQGLDGSTKGLDGSPQGLDESAQGLDRLAQGLDESAQGLDLITQGFDELSDGEDDLNLGLDASTQGTDSETQGVNEWTPEEDILSDRFKFLMNSADSMDEKIKNLISSLQTPKSILASDTPTGGINPDSILQRLNFRNVKSRLQTISGNKEESAELLNDYDQESNRIVKENNSPAGLGPRNLNTVTGSLAYDSSPNPNLSKIEQVSIRNPTIISSNYKLPRTLVNLEEASLLQPSMNEEKRQTEPISGNTRSRNQGVIFFPRTAPEYVEYPAQPLTGRLEDLTQEASGLSPKFSAFPALSVELRNEDNSKKRNNDAPPSLDRSSTETGTRNEDESRILSRTFFPDQQSRPLDLNQSADLRITADESADPQDIFAQPESPAEQTKGVLALLVTDENNNQFLVPASALK